MITLPELSLVTSALSLLGAALEESGVRLTDDDPDAAVATPSTNAIYVPPADGLGSATAGG